MTPPVTNLCTICAPGTASGELKLRMGMMFTSRVMIMMVMVITTRMITMRMIITSKVMIMMITTRNMIMVTKGSKGEKLLLLDRVHIYSGETLLRYPFGIGWPA